jgi:thioredoxin reductase (NADPH)
MLDVLVIGAGPAGLAAGIAARTHGLPYLIVERGSLVNSLLHYPTNMVFFTTPELLEVGGLPFVSPYEKPTRQEALRYYRRVADTFELEIAFSEPVTGLQRAADGDFRVTSQPARAEPRLRQARTVVVATGAFDRPNLLGIPGEDLAHVSHYYSEPHPYYRRRVVVVGGKNSAAEAALDLYRNGATVTLVHRGERLADSIKYWVLPDIENRIKEGSITGRFGTSVVEITAEDVVLDGPARRERVAADAVLLLTGYHSDPTLLRTAGADLDPASGAPVHHPDTFETSVPGLFVVGACVAGRESGRIFIENGRFHGAMAVKEIARRLSGKSEV